MYLLKFTTVLPVTCSNISVLLSLTTAGSIKNKNKRLRELVLVWVLETAICETSNRGAFLSQQATVLVVSALFSKSTQ